MDIKHMLPAEVLATLAPAVPLIMAEARAGTVEVERARAIRAGKTTVRAHGHEYARGALRILTPVHPGATLDEYSPTGALAPCSDDNACGYCGCCDECGVRHDISIDSGVLVSRRGQRYCAPNCEHWCAV